MSGPRTLWQRFMIGLAGHARLQRLAQGNSRLDLLARRFVGGRDIPEAIAIANALRDRGLTVSFNVVGEYLNDSAAVDRNMASLLKLPAAAVAAGLEVHISVDPTAIGYAIDERLGRGNAERLAAIYAGLPERPQRSVLMLDMEDFALVEPTLELYRRMLNLRLPVALTLQAYLRRTAADLDPLLHHPTSVRLVKGAFAETEDRAYPTRGEVSRNYYRLALEMLSDTARASGFLPVFGTHDHRLIEAIADHADANGWPRDRYEFEMLYGVRPDLQRRLVAAGHRVRLYLPFGRDWWPYVARRLGESPGNVMLALRAVLTPG